MPHLCYLVLVCQHKVSDESRFIEAGEMKSTLREWPVLEDTARKDKLFWLLGCMYEKGWERSIIFKHIPCVMPTLSALLHFNLTFLTSFLSLDFCSPSLFDALLRVDFLQEVDRGNTQHPWVLRRYDPPHTGGCYFWGFSICLVMSIHFTDTLDS